MNTVMALCNRSSLAVFPMKDSHYLGLSESSGTLVGSPFKGILSSLGYKRGTPILGIPSWVQGFRA